MITYMRWAINNKCQLDCPYCFMRGKKLKEQTIVGQLNVLKYAKKLGVKTVDFMGKEPFFDKKIFEIMRKAQGFKFTAITNGINLEKYKGEILDSPLRSMTISYSGLKHRPDMLKLELLKEFYDNGIDIWFSFDMQPGNIQILNGKIDELEKLYPNTFGYFLNPIIPLTSMDWCIAPDIFEETVQPLLKRKENKIIFYIYTYLQNNGVKINDPRVVYEDNCDLNSVFVDCEGFVHNCGNAASFDDSKKVWYTHNWAKVKCGGKKYACPLCYGVAEKRE